MAKKNSFKVEYNKQLKDPRWKQKRLKIIVRDNNKCLNCGTSKNLQVHHTFYINGNKPWEYENYSLLTLCSSCHNSHHKNNTDLTHISQPLKDDYLKTKRIKRDRAKAIKKQQLELDKIERDLLASRVTKLESLLGIALERIEQLEQEVFLV